MGIHKVGKGLPEEGSLAGVNTKSRLYGYIRKLILFLLYPENL